MDNNPVGACRSQGRLQGLGERLMLCMGLIDHNVWIGNFSSPCVSSAK